MSNHQSQRRARPRVKLPLWAAILIGSVATILVLVIVGLTGSWLFNTVREAVASLNSADTDFNPSLTDGGDSITGLSDPLVSSDGPGGQEGPVLSAEMFQPWSGTERVNILLLGIDLRCDEEGPTHTDSMMVVTVDPVGMSAAALSLPRDMWVEIPGFGVNRINQAFFQGDAYDYPGGGAALAVETVEATLGVPIDYYLAVNFEGFIEFVDLIGGISVEAKEEIDDPDYPDSCYGYDPFYIDEGIHELDGAMALKYARTRATAGSDIDRAARQQEVVMAVRDQVLRLNMIPRLLAQAPQLWRSFQKNVDTNMGLEETIQLALLAQDIPRDKIRTMVIDYSYVYNEQTPDGQMVLVPNRERIRGLRDQLFAPPAIPTPVIENLPELAREENARVHVQNGTSAVGLAASTQEYLVPFGINVVEIGNAEGTLPSTQIVDYGSHLNTTRYIAELLKVPPLNITYSTRPPAGDYDVLVILGNDQTVTPTPEFESP
ncbi:MAG: LCP family protein [Anaerolineae bacterium]|nr:LCP family protein [Anaerolineae bacterium]